MVILLLNYIKFNQTKNLKTMVFWVAVVHLPTEMFAVQVTLEPFS